MLYMSVPYMSVPIIYALFSLSIFPIYITVSFYTDVSTVRRTIGYASYMLN